MANDIYFTFDPIEELGSDVPKKSREQALDEVAEYLKEAMLDRIGRGLSPVSGGHWKRSLSKEYKKLKQEISGVDFANLELSGDLLDSLVVRAGGNGIEITVGDDQAGKAEGHLLGSYGREPNEAKSREFMPWQDGHKFKRDILFQIKQILADFEEE